MHNSTRKLLALTIISLIMTGLVIASTGYASLGELVDGNGFQNAVKDFTSADRAARQSVRDSAGNIVSSTPPPPPTSYAGERMKIFNINGFFEVFGFYPKSSVGVFGGRVSPTLSQLLTIPQGNRFDGEQGWFIVVYYVGTNAKGKEVYQINLYNNVGVLQDDRFWFEKG